MNRLMNVFTVCLLVAAAATAQSDEPEKSKSRTVSVRGSGSVFVEPDQVRLTMQVTVRGETAASAMTMASERTAEVLKLLRSFNVQDRDIRTTRISVAPVYDREKRIQPPPIIGYAASNDISVLFRKETMEKLGDFMDRSVAMGASNFGNLMFESSRARELERDALARAAADARSRAESLAGELGATVGNVLSLKETGMHTPGPIPMDYIRSETAAMAAPVMAGESEITANVDVVFELKDR